MFDTSLPSYVGVLVLVAGVSGLLLGGVLMGRRIGDEPEARSFRATDRPGAIGRMARIAGTVLPWVLALVLAGSLIWIAAITLRLVPA
jgi:hypothetical protein